jgi:uncharacterized protein YqeY
MKNEERRMSFTIFASFFIFHSSFFTFHSFISFSKHSISNNMALFEKVSSDIIAAMKAKDAVRRDTLRNVKKYFLEAKTAPGANDELTDDAALKILQKLAKQGRESAEIYKGQGRADLAEEEMAQVRVIEEYLPKQLSEEELETKLKEIIAELGASGPQDMGKVMGVSTKKLAGLAEGRAISACVKKLLTQG